MLSIFTGINKFINLMLCDDENRPASVALSDESKMAIFNCLEKLEHPKGYLLVRPGDVCRHIYFIEKGAARIFYYKDDKDVTDGFRGKETLLLSTVSFVKQKPDQRGIELLDNTSLWALSYKNLEMLCDKHHDIEKLYRLVISSAVVMAQQRMDWMLFQSAQERYDDFMKAHKGIDKLLTLGMISSFLGIAPETLSRIRKSKR